MAFLRKEIKPSGTYLRIVESYRDKNGKSRHKTIYNLGKAEDYSKSTLNKIGKIFIKLSGETIPAKINVREMARYNYGFVQVYDKILGTYGLNKFFNSIQKKRKLNYDIYKHILLMLVERLNDPCSKLSNYNNRQEYYGLENIELHKLYRSLDHLHDNQKNVQDIIYQQGRHLFNQKLDVVFYDVTTFYFDSQWEDGFRMKGYSKDGKIGKTVIVFGLLIDKDKNPVGYQIYKGGFYEGHTFKDALRKLKKEYMIEKVITVADRGMMSKQNIELIEGEAGYEYIIGERLKNLPEGLQKKILDRTKYKQMEIEDEQSVEKIKIDYLLINHDGKRIIASYSEARAAKDRRDREERIVKGKEMLEKPWQADRKARMHYLKKEQSNKYELDENKISGDARYDGIVCIATNNKELDTANILSAYKQLYKIEQCFRTFKSYLETRPMFHWTAKRIEGHLCLCYIALTLLNYLQNTMKRNGYNYSENHIRKSLDKMQLSLVEQDGGKYYMRSTNNEEIETILKVLKLKEIPDFIPESSIKDYISIG